MKQRYKEALSEVEYIINQLESKDLEKVPKSFRDFIAENKCKWYKLQDIDNLKEETYAILSIIYRKFLASVEEREELEKEYQEKLKREKEQLKHILENSKVNLNTDINYNFVKVDTVNKLDVQLLEPKNEKWYSKILNKLKRVLHIN